jgi:hypothetical protein
LLEACEANAFDSSQVLSAKIFRGSSHPSSSEKNRVVTHCTEHSTIECGVFGATPLLLSTLSFLNRHNLIATDCYDEALSGFLVLRAAILAERRTKP